MQSEHAQELSRKSEEAEQKLQRRLRDAKAAHDGAVQELRAKHAEVVSGHVTGVTAEREARLAQEEEHRRELVEQSARLQAELASQLAAVWGLTESSWYRTDGRGHRRTGGRVAPRWPRPPAALRTRARLVRAGHLQVVVLAHRQITVADPLAVIRLRTRRGMTCRGTAPPRPAQPVGVARGRRRAYMFTRRR